MKSSGKNIGGCLLFSPNDREHYHTGSEESGCFYFPALPLGPLMGTGGASARAARIEVKDKDDDLHMHKGAVIAFISAGSGVFKTCEGIVDVRQGDIIYIPPLTAHLSVAERNTVMIEHIVYLSSADDMQESIAVPA